MKRHATKRGLRQKSKEKETKFLCYEKTAKYEAKFESKDNHTVMQAPAASNATMPKHTPIKSSIHNDA